MDDEGRESARRRSRRSARRRVRGGRAGRAGRSSTARAAPGRCKARSALASRPSVRSRRRRATYGRPPGSAPRRNAAGRPGDLRARSSPPLEPTPPPAVHRPSTRRSRAAGSTALHRREEASGTDSQPGWCLSHYFTKDSGSRRNPPEPEAKQERSTKWTRRIRPPQIAGTSPPTGTPLVHHSKDGLDQGIREGGGGVRLPGGPPLGGLLVGPRAFACALLGGVGVC